MPDTDDLILDCIKEKFKTVREISNEIDVFYGRVSVRIKALRRRNMVTAIQSEIKHVVGVKPLKYRKKND